MCEFRAVLAVEPPALAGEKNGTRKSEPADELSFFFNSSLNRFQVLSNRNKERCEQNDRMLHEEIFAAHSKI